MVRIQVVKCFKGSGPRRATGLIPSERSHKTMGRHVEFVLFHWFHVELSCGKGGPGNPTGGWGPGHSGAPLRPGGECFAPLCGSMSSLFCFMDFTWGTPPGRRGGLRSTLLQVTLGFHASYIIKIMIFELRENHNGSSRNTWKHPRWSLMTPWYLPKLPWVILWT